MEKALSENIYFSLDEAREELKKRWNDAELKKKVEDELGENFWPEFKDNPRAFLGRCLVSPDNGLAFFVNCAKYVNAIPLDFEYLGDKFASINDEKRGLSYLCVRSETGDRMLMELVDLGANEGKKIGEVITKSGEKLADFHHNLLEVAKYDVEAIDRTEWFRNFEKPAIYYNYYLSHFIAHGVLFETFLADGDERETSFTNKIVMPALEEVERRFGLKPLVVRLYPENQDDLEDFYWWSYPPNINDYIINYANKHKIPLKKLE